MFHVSYLDAFQTSPTTIKQTQMDLFIIMESTIFSTNTIPKLLIGQWISCGVILYQKIWSIGFRLDVAMYPKDSFDINGCWSGSATILPGNKPVMLYTGIDINRVQVQNIAVPKDSSDPLLIEWKKLDENPLILPPNGINATSFRDPTTAWFGKDGYWRILVGSLRINCLGTVLLFRSKDLMSWTESENNFQSAPDWCLGMSRFLSCVTERLKRITHYYKRRADVKHILKVSPGEIWSDFYTVGDYCQNKDEYVPDDTQGNHYSATTGLKFDYRKFYASKTFFDESKSRRVIWAWVNESDSLADDFAKGWAGIQAIPRTLWLDKNGKQLLQWPIEELETLRTDEVKLKKTPLTKGGLFEVQGLTAAQADIEVTFRLPSLENAESFDPLWNDAQRLCGRKDATVQGGIGPFGLLTLVSKDFEEYTAVFFRVFKAENKPVVLVCSGGIRSSLKAELDKPSYGAFVDVDLVDGEISLRSLIDHTVVESFGAGGKTCITTRVYPTLAVGKEAHLYVFNNGTETVEIKRLNAWTMQTPKMNLGSEMSSLFAA